MVEDTSQQFRTLLVPLDGSHLAEAVLPAVECLASRFHATVTLLHVLEQAARATIHGQRHLTDSAEAKTYLGGVAERLRATGIAVTIHVHGVREGDVARSIVDHSQEINADLVILCTHGGSGLRGVLFGSIAQQVLRQGAEPILLIPPGAAERTSAHRRSDRSPAAAGARRRRSGGRSLAQSEHTFRDPRVPRMRPNISDTISYPTRSLTASP